MSGALRAVTLAATLNAIGKQVIEATGEAEFFGYLAASLRSYTGCDAVMMRLLDRADGTRFIATRQGVDVVHAAACPAAVTKEEESRWFSWSDGVYFSTPGELGRAFPRLKEDVGRLGVTSVFLVPLLRGGEAGGEIVFGWRYPPELDGVTRSLLCRLADCASVMTALFQMKKGQEIDPMTALPNRLSLRLRWNRGIGAGEGSLVFVSLEGLQTVRAACGPLEGDNRLRRIGLMLNRACGEGAVVGRYGCHDFVALLPGAERPAAEAVGNEVERQYRVQTCAHRGPHPRLVTGIARWPEDGTDLDALVAAAERRAGRPAAAWLPGAM